MCGIAGWLGAGSGLAEVAAVQAALAALAHRGPDDSGLFVFSPRDHIAELRDQAGIITRLPPPASEALSLVLGHRRLAIIDPSPAGHQPMCTPDGRFVLVLNGEIYNYIELRRELEALGVTFRSRSDTEVLLQAWARWGHACLPRLTGMFAFVVVDLVARRLTFARDPFGMKPLYYREADRGLAFASEIRPLLALSRATRRANPRRVLDYLDTGITDHGDQTMFADIRALPAAHYAVVALDGPGVLEPVAYWSPSLEGSLALPFDAAARRLRELFVESVGLHLRADTRVGTLLSGGVDSSAIVMAMREIAGRQLELHTFAYVAGQGAISEEPWIDVVNAASGARVDKLSLQPDDWARDFGAVVAAQGEPFGSLAIFVQYRLFQRAARAGVRVLLSGQGADELLGGYRRLWPLRLAGLLRRGEWRAAGRLLSGIRRLRRWWEPTPSAVAARAALAALPAFVTRFALAGRRRAGLVSPAWRRRHGFALHPPAYGETRPLREIAWADVSTNSLPALLRYEDRNAMAHSVEPRLPFLTPALAEFALALPDACFVGPAGANKPLLREALRGLVPDAVLARPEKVGFAVPIRTWFDQLSDAVALVAEAAELAPVHRPAVEPLLAALRTRGRLPDEGYFRLWRLVGLAAWARYAGVSFD